MVKPVEFVNCVIDHILFETEEYTMPVILDQARWVLKFLMSIEEAQPLSTSLCKVLLKKLADCPTKSMQTLIISTMIPLLSED